MRMIVELQVFAGEELLLSRALPPRRPLVLGPGRTATVPTTALEHDAAVLEPTPGGYRVHLPAGLDGCLLAAGRRLRIVDGLLHDPRPEPLLLADGDRGELRLGDGLRLRFGIHAQRGELRARWRLDSALALSLSGSALAGLGLVLLCLGGGGAPRPSVREPRLMTRPAALITLARARPEPPRLAPARAGRATPQRARVSRAPAVPAVARLAGERVLRRLLPTARSGRRASDPLAALDGLLARADGHRPRPGTSSAGDPLLTAGGAGGLPGVLALPKVAPLARERPLALPTGHTRESGPSREAIRKVVSAGSPRVRLCYERELLAARTPREGQIILRWEIDAAGRVSGLRIVKDTVGSAGLAHCLGEEVGRWTFPPCPERCVIRYPFDFYARSLGGV